MLLEELRHELTPWNLESEASSFPQVLFYLTWRPFFSPQSNRFLINFVPCISHSPPWMLQAPKFFLRLLPLYPFVVIRNLFLSIRVQPGIYHRCFQWLPFSAGAWWVPQALLVLSVRLQKRATRRSLLVPLWSSHHLTVLLEVDMLATLVGRKGAKFFAAQWGVM